MIAAWAMCASRVATLIEVEHDPRPVVRALARDLAACLEDNDFDAETRGAHGVVAVRSASTPEAATLRIENGRVSISHGADEDADVTATAVLAGSDGAPRIDGSREHPKLAEWASRLLDPPTPAWPEAAERFWAVLSSKPGAPGAMLAVDLETGKERRFGSDAGSACEVHGPPAGLVSVFTGRVSLMEAAYDGTVCVRCRFPDLSVLSGAGFEIRYGGEPADG
jgi:hypothetical protein